MAYNDIYFHRIPLASVLRRECIHPPHTQDGGRNKQTTYYNNVRREGGSPNQGGDSQCWKL